MDRIHRFGSRSSLSAAADERAAEGFRIAHVDASEWRNEDDLHDALAAALHFPDYFGRNLNALEDCLRDVGDRWYGWDANDLGLLIVVGGYATWDDTAPDLAAELLDIAVGTSAEAALSGNDVRWYFEDSPTDPSDVRRV